MTSTRAHALEILRAGIAAAAADQLVTRALQDTAPPDRVHLLAVGKAAVPMARAAHELWADRIGRALIVAPQPASAPWPVHVAEHPVPGNGSVQAARAAVTLLYNVAPGDVILALLSGGTSSLLAQPALGLSLHDLAHTTHALMHAGADIAQLNCVRKHLDDVKGGGLARRAAPARVLCLLLSDVPGDDPGTIGSGPFAPDPTTFADARRIVQELGVEPLLTPAVRAHLARAHGETLKPGDAALDSIETHVIGSNRTALYAAAARAADLGYTARIHDALLTGEARAAAEVVPIDLAPRTAWLAGGETTVTVRGAGRGGRNQELALAAALRIGGSDVVIGCAGTDGIDGNSPAAGAIVDGTTAEMMRAHGMDAARALENNDSYTALAAAGHTWVTGPTDTNVMDLVVALRG